MRLEGQYALVLAGTGTGSARQIARSAPESSTGEPKMISSTLRQRMMVRCLRCYSAQATPSITAPPMLVKVRNDMKAAMKAKDSAKLDVLRGLIAETTNAAKTSSPVNTDTHMLSLIRKKIKSSQGAIAEFEAAKRDDLTRKELSQIAVLEAYIKDSNVMSEEDLTRNIQDSIGKMRTDGHKTDKGSVMRALVGPGGALEGQLVDKKDVARLVDGML